ncbi:MAG: MlaE family ABC transporter permease [Burkholderiales bacterium]
MASTFSRHFALAALPHSASRWSRAALRWMASWWRLLQFGAVILVLALTPSSYARDNRAQFAHHIYRGTAPSLVWFTVLCALGTLVITRIVVVTALSYGLSQYALQVVIRVLVLELIPMGAALFVTLRCTLPSALQLALIHQTARQDTVSMEPPQGIGLLRVEVLPRVVAGMFASATLAALSCVVALVLAYLAVYGFTSSALPSYTRLFGQVFNPAVTLIFLLKTLLLALAVSIIPMAAALQDSGEVTHNPKTASGYSAASAELRVLVRLFAVLLLIEAVCLVGNYY